MHTLPYQNYISNLSPAGPLPEATFVLPEMDIPRMGAILAGEVQPS